MGSPDVACALSPVISVSAAEREATDGWCGAAQCGLIINSVLCCRGALDACCVTSARLNRCLSSFFFFLSFFLLRPPPLSTVCSLLHLQSLPSRPGSPPTLPQRCASGVIMDHVNASEATRLESHCCCAHGQQAPPAPHTPKIISAFLLCRPLAPS